MDEVIVSDGVLKYAIVSCFKIFRFFGLYNQRSLKFYPYITSIASKPKAHNVINDIMRSSAVIQGTNCGITTPTEL